MLASAIRKPAGDWCIDKLFLKKKLYSEKSLSCLPSRLALLPGGRGEAEAERRWGEGDNAIHMQKSILLSIRNIPQV